MTSSAVQSVKSVDVSTSYLTSDLTSSERMVRLPPTNAITGIPLRSDNVRAEGACPLGRSLWSDCRESD